MCASGWSTASHRMKTTVDTMGFPELLRTEGNLAIVAGFEQSAHNCQRQALLMVHGLLIKLSSSTTVPKQRHAAQKLLPFHLDTAFTECDWKALNLTYAPLNKRHFELSHSFSSFHSAFTNNITPAQQETNSCCPTTWHPTDCIHFIIQQFQYCKPPQLLSQQANRDGFWAVLKIHWGWAVRFHLEFLVNEIHQEAEVHASVEIVICPWVSKDMLIWYQWYWRVFQSVWWWLTSHSVLLEWPCHLGQTAMIGLNGSCTTEYLKQFDINLCSGG